MATQRWADFVNFLDVNCLSKREPAMTQAESLIGNRECDMIQTVNYMNREDPGEVNFIVNVRAVFSGQ